MFRAALLSVAVTASAALPAFAAPAWSAEPTCFGEKATVRDRSGEIVGTKGDDVIVGDDGPNVIYGEGGNDRICGLDGDDEIESDFDSGRLWANGGSGNDDIDHKGSGSAVLVGGPDVDFINDFSSVGGKVRAGGGEDYVFASFGPDVVKGGGGNDTLRGYDGDDTVSGGPGEDELYGDEGFDRLDGGANGDLCQVGPDGGRTRDCEREA